ncbi:hypothetical protein GOP47_0010268 [Adiantum capillus-veneris]|uniref:Sucrose-phosphate synthase n=1 Tax=Adiantum capillus-veneris TaxID=13818 RepID=A0A9D4UVN7_ADICA|nr:hypothetical protein GOP47_0010268 [Adiantum capillus-veneris]
MAGNEWINGYLEAILDAGSAAEPHHRSPIPAPIAESNIFNPTKYFVEEVVGGFDESDIHRSWLKATATKNVHERNIRLENMCWRIWHLARKKKQIEWEHAQRLAKRRLEREQAHKDATEDISDFSEGEKSDPALVESRMPRASSVDYMEAWAEQHKEKKLYIILISLHGLVRGEDMELGRDSDTGGQVKYVVELARALALMPQVYRVDLLTRQICSPEVNWIYGEPTEQLTHRNYRNEEQELGESSGAYIVRIPFGPRECYLRKELLWPYIQEFVDGALAHVCNMSKVLGEQVGNGELVWPHVVHGHYADAAHAAAMLSGALNVPMVTTGHSLGRNKLEQLLKQGRQSKEDINATYKIMRRIEAEELSLDASELVITSTKQEIDEQWGLYDGFNAHIARYLRAKTKHGVSCNGHYFPRMVVIPPGMEFNQTIEPDSGDAADDFDAVGDVPSLQEEPPIWTEIMRFFTNPRKPMILALARPDSKKNMTTLVKAFGESRPLRELANLTLIMGNRDDIDGMSSGNAAVLTTILKLIDKYDLYGLVAYPKHHKQAEVSDIYRLAAKTKGVFVNPALVEPFGLTLIEAAANGLPTVATRNGGPVDIHRVLKNGSLVDPHNHEDIADALLKLLADKQYWTECQRNGLKNIYLYSWPEHCKMYLSRIALCRMRHPKWRNEEFSDVDSDSQEDSLRDVNDLKISFDGDRASLDGSIDIGELLASEGNKVEEKSSADSSENLRPIPYKKVLLNSNSIRTPAVRRRKRLITIAVDSYDAAEFVSVVKHIFEATRSKLTFRGAGYILSSSLKLHEILKMLDSGGISTYEFDAFVCSSGSELFYPSVSTGDDTGNSNELQFCVDSDYEAHIAYRWHRDILRRSIAKWSAATNQQLCEALDEEDKGCTHHCLAYTAKNASMCLKVDEFRKRLRNQGLRCHVIYCQNSSRLHIIPLLASRAQALRYLFVRWGLDISNVLVFVGERGDTDYEGLLSGTHRTMVLKGSVKLGSENLLRSTGSYQREDVVPIDSPRIVYTKNSYGPDEISSALAELI